MPDTREVAPACRTFPDTGQPVRILMVDDEPWWVARDVADVLGYRTANDATRCLDDDEKGTHTVRTPGGDQQMVTVSEAGLYSLILRSRRPQARAFKRWVTHEVLPTLRRTGQYSPPRAEPTKLELARDLVAALELREQLERRNAELEPSATAWDTLAADSTGDYSVREAAQILNRAPGIHTGQNRLFTTLRELGWIDRHGTPYQTHVDNGRLVRRVRNYPHPRTGEPVLTSQVRITPTGLAALHTRLTGQVPITAVSSPA